MLVPKLCKKKRLSAFMRRVKKTKLEDEHRANAAHGSRTKKIMRPELINRF